MALGLVLPLAATAVTLSESFENGALDPRITVASVGGFTFEPGVKPLTNFGSANAFGFGRSGCPFDCFEAHATGLLINLGSPQYVSTLAFKEMELFGNWGSGGAILVDGVLLGTTYYDFGRLPYNDLVADQSFREHTFNLNRVATTIELRVSDITYTSEIYLDDLVLNGVPEPSSSALLLAGVGVVLAVGVRRKVARN